MRVLVCGSRYWDDYDIIRATLDNVSIFSEEENDVTITIIEGGAPGADSLAAKYATNAMDWVDYVYHEQYTADWEKYGRAAGPIRNKQMLQRGKPDIVFAFTDNLEESKGTKNMVTLAKEAGVRTYVIGRA